MKARYRSIGLSTKDNPSESRSTSRAQSSCKSDRLQSGYLAESMETALVVQAAQKVSTHTGVGKDPLYHSDRGCQTTNSAMRAWFSVREIIQSRSAVGDCYDNATGESFFTHLKREVFPVGCVFDSKTDAQRITFEAIGTFDNRTRIHTSLGNLSSQRLLIKYFQTEKITLN